MLGWPKPGRQEAHDDSPLWALRHAANIQAVWRSEPTGEECGRLQVTNRGGAVVAQLSAFLPTLKRGFLWLWWVSRMGRLC